MSEKLGTIRAFHNPFYIVPAMLVTVIKYLPELGTQTKQFSHASAQFDKSTVYCV